MVNTRCLIDDLHSCDIQKYFTHIADVADAMQGLFKIWDHKVLWYDEKRILDSLVAYNEDEEVYIKHMEYIKRIKGKQYY